ncbi:SBP-1 protein [Aphelenchoides avenae]|nr:SBP-1 protein [Aphelenchus avenae]
MNMNDDVFMSDPFLSLDVDLDDVSEVIRSNAFGDQKMLCEGSRTPSPQYLRDSDVFVSPMQQMPSTHMNTDAEREIGHIVSLLQENAVEVYPPQGMQDPFQTAYSNNVYVQHGHLYNTVPQQGEYHQFVENDAVSSYAVYTTDAFSQHSALGVPTTASAIDMQEHVDVQEYHTQVHETRVRSIKQEAHSPGSPPTPMRTKTELIRMLLEMSPTELENMRRGKNRAAQPPVDPPSDASSQQVYRSMTPVEHNPIDPMDTSPQRVFMPSGLLSPTTSTAPSASNNWRDDSDGESEHSSQQPRKGPKTERRTAHNLIEKKYRCSINDRINHLKEMLAGDENKLSKSATLRKAIEHINGLRNQNSELIKENERLRAALAKTGVEVASVGLRTNHTNAAYQSSSATSRESSLSPQSQPNDAVPPSRSKKSRPMLDQSRVTLCVFVFAMIFFNPVSLLFTSDSPTMAASAGSPDLRMKVPHRTLQSITDDEPFDSSGSSGWFDQSATQNFLIWTLNAIIVGIVLTRLLIFGEPVTDRRSPTWTAFMAAKQNSIYAVSVGNYKEARRQLSDALQVIDRALPSHGGFEELMSVVWQIIRHFLNGLWIGRWLARRRRSATLPVPAVCKSHAATALVYHQLHQLHLIGITGSQCGHLYALNLALSAANLSESAGISKTGVTHKKRAEIYLNAALRMKLSLPRFLAPVFTAYFIRRARRHVRKSMSNDGVEWRSAQWFFHPLAHNFLGNKEVLLEILENPRQMTNFPFLGFRLHT